MLSEALGPLQDVRAGPIQIRLEVQRIEDQPLLTYLEKETIRSLTCASCGRSASVYGIALCCPFCGQRDVLGTFLQSLEAARSCVAAVANLSPEGRQLLQASGGEDRLAENALRDGVTAFEVYCKDRYRQLLGQPALETLLKQSGPNCFQRLGDAIAAMESALGRKLTTTLTPGEWTELELAFAARHVLTHNFGVADLKYQLAGGKTPLGQRVQVTRTNAERFLSLVERLIRGML
jgi:hypothetical protein